MKTYIYRRLWEVLSGKEQAKPYDRLDAASRRAIEEILLQTKTDLPDYWKKAKRFFVKPAVIGEELKKI